VIALAASLGANVATAGLLAAASVPAWLRILVAGWPALAFLGGTLLAHSPAPVSQPIPDAPAPAEPVTEAEPVKSAVAVPATLVAHARKVAADHLTRTGTAIDIPTLRARLGVPAQLAEAIAAQL
jgi:hypothetical protein